MRKIYLMSLGLLLSTSAAFSQYCTVGVGPTSTFDTNVEAVALTGETTNIAYTGCLAGGITGVEDQTIQDADLIAGNAYSVDVTWGTCGGSYGNAGEIWIDFDGSQTYDPSESIGDINWAGGTGNLQNYAFVVPALALNGTHQMRVICWEGGFNPLDPCGSYTYGSMVDFSITISGGSSCGPATALNVSGNTGTSIDLNWTADVGAVSHNIEWGFPGFTPGTGAQQGMNLGVVGATTNAAGLTFDTDYEFYVQTDCGGSTSGWAGPFAFFTGYCQVSTTNNFDYLSLVSSSGAVQNVTYTAVTQPAGSYADETGQTIESFAGGTFDVATTYQGGSNGLNIWVDWNNDLDFDDPGENIFYLADGNASKLANIIVPGAQALGSYRMRVRGQWGTTANPPSCGSVNYGSTVDFTLLISTPPACPPPILLTATNVTGSTVDLGWTETGSATEWAIEYGAPGFTPGTGTTVNTTNNPETVTGLLSTTTYDIYVRAVCGVADTSAYAGPANFTTPLANLVCGIGNAFILYANDFESGSFPSDWSHPSTVDPDWTYDNVGGTGSSNTGPSAAHSGTGFVYLETSGGSMGQTDTLISPAIDLSSVVDAARLTFYYHMYGADIGTMEVLVSSDNMNWNNVWSQTAQVQTDELDPWIPAEVDLTTYAGGMVYIRIVGSKGGTSFAGDMAVDLVQVEGCVTCPGPANLLTSNLTATSVDLAWTEQGSATDWVIEYGPAGFTPGTGTTMITTNNPETVSGLNNLTGYDFYVGAICGVGDTSGYVGPANVYTPIAPLNCTQGNALVLYNTDFEGGVFPADWSQVNAADPDWTYDNAGGTGSANTGPSAAHSGTAFIYLETSSGSAGQADTLIAPAVNLGSVTAAARMTFFYHMYGADIGTMEVLVSSDNVNWNTEWSVTGQVQTDELDPWLQAEVDLTSYAGGMVYVRFVGTKGGTGFTGDMAVDLVEFEGCISCPDPSNLVASNATFTTVDLAWTVGGTETAWIIEYGAEGFTPGTGTMVNTTNNPETLTGLIDNTIYDFYVYADCGGGDTSLPIGPAADTTLVVCAVPTNFAFTYTSNDTVAFTWTPGGLESSWIVEYGPVGFTPGTGTAHTATILPDTITGLPNGVYEFYVQADCVGGGLNNPWAGPLFYVTPITNDDACGAINVPVDGSTTTYANLNATEGVGTPVTGFNTVWFTFTAPASGHVEIKTCGVDNNFDNMMEVYTATDCNDFLTFSYENGATGNPFVTCVGVGSPSGMNLCGLTPGNQYYLVIGAENAADEGLFPLTLKELPSVDAGAASAIDVCIDNGAVDLYTAITGNLTSNGQWYNTAVGAGNEEVSTIDASVLSAGTYPYFYVDIELCGSDTVATSVTVVDLPIVGTGSTINAGCNFGDVNLFDGLNGIVDLGGTWYDASSTALTGGTANFEGEPAGTYVYDYVVDNGVCAADTATVSVDVIDCTSINENNLEVIVYPNPVNDILNVQLSNIDANTTIQLINMNGQVVIAPIVLLTSTATVDMSSIESGVYFLKVTSNGATAAVRLVKQ